MGNLQGRHFIEQLADKGDGHYAYIDGPRRGAARCSSDEIERRRS